MSLAKNPSQDAFTHKLLDGGGNWRDRAKLQTIYLYLCQANIQTFLLVQGAVICSIN